MAVHRSKARTAAPDPRSFACPKCDAAPGQQCITGGYMPVGDVPGDPYRNSANQLDSHRQRKTASRNLAAQQEGSTVTSTEGIPSTPVAAPAVDVPLDGDIGAALANPDEYNGPIEQAVSESEVAGDSPTVPDLPATGTDAGPEITDEDRKKAITEVYSQTSTWLREKYRDEFHGKMKQLLSERGIDWAPKPTKAERAKAKARQTLLDAGLPIPDDLQ